MLLELARHPIELQRCQEAVDDILGNRKSAAANVTNNTSATSDNAAAAADAADNAKPVEVEDYDDGERVSYDQLLELLKSHLGRVLKECLRMHPPLPIFGRRTTARATQLGPYSLPANTWVAVAVMATHYDETLWERPFEFLPERWDTTTTREKQEGPGGGNVYRLKHPFQYIPFSSGARSCVGARFGELEAIAVVAHVLRRFNLSISDAHLAKVRAVEAILYTPKDVTLTVSLRR
jgi:cytochrome P450